MSAKRSAAGRSTRSAGWEQYRADRLAAGLPATKREEMGRKPDRFADLEIDLHWQNEARRAGLIPPGTSTTECRRIAFRYAQAVAAETARRASEKISTAATSADDRAAYWKAEIVRLTNAEAAALRRAADFGRLRDEAAGKLADLHDFEGGE